MAISDTTSKNPENLDYIKSIISGELAQEKTKMRRSLGNRQEPDNREYPRSSKFLMVDYSNKTRFFRDFSDNISAGGMFIRTRQNFNAGQDLVLAFTFEESNIPVKLNGRIVRTDAAGIGVRFKWFNG